MFNTIYTISRDKCKLVLTWKLLPFILNHNHCDTHFQINGQHMTQTKRNPKKKNCIHFINKIEINTDSDTCIVLKSHFEAYKFSVYFISYAWQFLRKLQFTTVHCYKIMKRKKYRGHPIHFITNLLKTEFDFHVVWHLKPLIVLIWNYFAAYNLIKLK